MKLRTAVTFYSLTFTFLVSASKETITKDSIGKATFGFGMTSYQLLSRSVGVYAFRTSGKKHHELHLSYTYATNYDGSYLFPVTNDHYFSKGVNVFFHSKIPEVKAENNSRWSVNTVLGLRYWWNYYSHITNGKVGDEVGYTIQSSQKFGVTAGIEANRRLKKSEGVTFFVRPLVTNFWIDHEYFGTFYYKYPDFVTYKYTKYNEIRISLGFGFKFFSH